MARIVKNTENVLLSCNIITKYSDGTSSTLNIKEEDEVTDLRYRVGELIIPISGRVSAINFTCPKITRVNLNKPLDNFSKDVKIKSIVIDKSEDYESDVVAIPAEDLMGEEGESTVDSISVLADVKVTMDMEYTDGSVVNQDLEIGDVIKDAVIMTSPKKPDLTGIFKLVAWAYKATKTGVNVTGVYLRSLTGVTQNVSFERFISFTEADSANVSDPSSLVEISEALNGSETGEVFATLGVDVAIPDRPDGKITTTLIALGKTLNIDLNGHKITTKAYAFYVNGGELNISDSTGKGGIICTEGDKKAYPAVYVNGGVCNMTGGLIDTTQAITPEGSENWLYGVVCSNDGVFNMTGGTMKIKGASGISITNGTASGAGASFIIGGDSKITSTECAAIYLADNKSLVIKDNAVIEGGMVLRMGDISIEGNATVNGHRNKDIVYPLGEQVVLSGVGAPEAPILALTGIYNSSLGNDMNINIAKTAKVNGYLKNGIDIAMINTLYDQNVDIDIEDKKSINAKSSKWNIYTHDELAELAAEAGKTLAPENSTTNLTIKANGKIVYPENS